MGQVLHGSATTTEAVRRAIQHSQESLRTLAKRYGINQKTVAKWKRRISVADLPTGPKEARSTVLSVEEEAVIVAFRRYTLLPLDDCLYALQPTIPRLTRSSLHRCLQRHGIGRLPDVDGDKPARKKFKSYPIGYFHIDIAEVRTEQGKLHMFVAIDRTSKFAFVELHERATTAISREFLLRLIAAVPYKIHTVLTDNGIQFTTPGAGGSAVRLAQDRAPDAFSGLASAPQAAWPAEGRRCASRLGHRTQCARSSVHRDAPEPALGRRLHLHLDGGRLALCGRSDLFSRRVVGWSMKAEMTAALVTDALIMAIWRRGKPDALLHHSDQGSQYTSQHFQELLVENGVTCSMSRSGNVWDNAAMESFFSSLKIERIRGKVYRTRDAARADVFDYIERFYNTVRRHSTIGYLSPVEFEKKVGLA